MNNSQIAIEPSESLIDGEVLYNVGDKITIGDTIKIVRTPITVKMIRAASSTIDLLQYVEQ